MSEAFYCQTQDLAIGYGKTPLLQNIGIGVQRGQILALIGPNGAGKSTLLKTLAGQLAAQSGAVLLQGQNLTTYTPNARARKMALMLPHTRHTELTTCFDVAAAGRYPYTGRLGILSEQDRMQVRDALHLVQADELADRDFTKSVMASASAFCWPAPSASSRKSSCWTNQRHFWTSKAKLSC